MPTCSSWKNGPWILEMEALQGESLVSNSIYAKKDRNGPPIATLVSSKDEPRHGHAVCTLWVHPPTSTCPTLSAHAEPKSQGHCSKWHHEVESLMTDISAMGPKEVLMAGYQYAHSSPLPIRSNSILNSSMFYAWCVNVMQSVPGCGIVCRRWIVIALYPIDIYVGYVFCGHL